MRYYEWCVKNLALIARPFPKVNTDEDIRLFIVAPEFTEEFLTVMKYLNSNLSLFQYTAIKNIETGDLGILYEEITVVPEKGPGVAFRSLDDIIKYFAKDVVRAEFEKVLNDLRTSGITILPFNEGKYYWIECKYKEDDIGYFQPYCLIQTGQYLMGN